MKANRPGLTSVFQHLTEQQRLILLMLILGLLLVLLMICLCLRASRIILSTMFGTSMAELTLLLSLLTMMA